MGEIAAISPQLKAHIDAMTRQEMAAHWRFAPSGDPMLQGSACTYFKDRFDRLGGFSPTISKSIGWGATAALSSNAPELLHALQVVLPLAKGYVAEHDVGRNREMCAWAEEIARKTEATSTQTEGKNP